MKQDKAFVVNGCSNHSLKERQEQDYYATPFIATEKLLAVESFSKNIYECFVGGGHIAKILTEHGYNVRCSDIVDRGYPNTEIIDFFSISPNSNSLLYDENYTIDADIVSNPPYNNVAKAWEYACDRITEGHKVAYMLKLTFLEGEERRRIFEKYPPSRIHVFSKRVSCAMNGEFDKYQATAIAHAWFVYDKGNLSKPTVDWI